MKFAEEQIADIMYNGGVYDESGKNCLYELVDETHAYYVIKEISTGKFFKSEGQVVNQADVYIAPPVGVPDELVGVNVSWYCVAPVLLLFKVIAAQL